MPASQNALRSTPRPSCAPRRSRGRRRTTATCSGSCSSRRRWYRLRRRGRSTRAPGRSRPAPGTRPARPHRAREQVPDAMPAHCGVPRSPTTGAIYGVVREHWSEFRARIDGADAAGDRRAALAAMREARGALQLVAQLTGVLREHVEVHQEEREFIASWASGAPATPTRRSGTPTTRPAAGTARCRRSACRHRVCRGASTRLRGEACYPGAGMQPPARRAVELVT